MSILWKILVCYLVGSIPLVAIVVALHLSFVPAFGLGILFGMLEFYIASKWEEAG